MLTILVGPAAAGKTEAALRELAATRAGAALLLLPGALHRQRLAARLRPLRRVRAGSFGYAARSILRLAGGLPDVAAPALRLAILREELGALAAAGRLPTLGAVATRGGVVAAAMSLIAELRAADIAPAALAAAGVSPYDADLAAAYAAYGAALDRYGLSDPDGLLARARDALRDGRVPGLRLDLLAVDGFDQLTPLQLGLLRELAGRAERTLVTLTGAPAARPAHARFARTLAALRAALPHAEVTYLPPPGALAAPLAQIERGLFEPAPPPPIDAGGAVELIRAPDREREVRAALRRAWGLLAAGAPAEAVGVLYRSGEHYGPLVREVAGEYGLPVALYEGLSLGEAPPIVALRGLLALPTDGFPRRAVAESWRALGAGEAAGLLERATLGAGRGLPRLRAALAALAAAEPAAGDDAAEGARVAPAAAAELLAALDGFVAWLAPPPEATPGAYVAWLRSLLGWDEAALDEPPSGAAATREGGAQQATGPARPRWPLWRASSPWPPAPAGALLPFSDEQRARLRQLLAEREATGRLLGEAARPYAAFVAELGGALDAARYGGAAPQAGKVAVLPILAARGQAFDHVILLGASDGALPARLPDPPFYTRRERARLAARGAAPPPADPGDERTLFYEAALRARRSLTLAYTRLDEGGNPLEPSPYVRALVGLFAEGSVRTTTILAGSAPSAAEAVSPQEALVAAAMAGALAGPAAALPPGARELAPHVARAALVERQREGQAPHGPYEGVVDHPAVAAALARRYGPDHRWSVTQINDYTICPFRFAAAHLLALGPRGEADDALAQVGRGQISHAILARAGEAWARLGAPFDQGAEAPVLAALAAAADEVLAAAPQRYGFEPGPFWAWEQAELRAALARAVARALRSEGWEGFRPAGVEASFGMGRGQPPLRVPTAAGEALVVGRIDRVDQDAQGNLALVDYKSGSTPRPLGATVGGRDVQLTVYTLAAEALGGPDQQVVRAAFLTLGNGRLSVPLTPAERPAAEEALRARLGAAMAGARAGDFAVRPSDGCPPGCAFAGVCRVNGAKAGG